MAMAPQAAPAYAEALAPLDAQDPGFARLSLERAPKLVWRLEIERVESSATKTFAKEPQRKADMVGLLLPGEGRALAAFTGVAPDGRRVNYYRVAHSDGR